MVKAENFHTMRGHVGSGQKILFGDGRIWEIRDGSNGWNLWEGDTLVSGGFDAYGLTSFIVKHSQFPRDIVAVKKPEVCSGG